MWQLYQREKMARNEPYPASSSLFPIFLVWQHLIMNVSQGGTGMEYSAHVSEQPFCAHIATSAVICNQEISLGIATDQLCVCFQSQMSSERPKALQGQRKWLQTPQEK